MKAHPHSQTGRGQLALEPSRRRHRVGGAGKHSEERLALRVYLATTAVANRGADQPVMLGQKLPVGVLADPREERGRSLDIREEKRDGPAGQMPGHPTSVSAPQRRIQTLAEQRCIEVALGPERRRLVSP